MNLTLREYKPSDLPFIKQMLYEAVFWRMKESERPPFEEGLNYDGAKNALEDWQSREGDAALVAEIGSALVGAIWYRYFTDDNSIRGYYDDSVPVIVIGVHRDYRRKGIGSKMMQGIFEHAISHNIKRLSLCVSKDNYALNLYSQQGFKEHIDIGDSYIMIKNLSNEESPISLLIVR